MEVWDDIFQKFLDNPKAGKIFGSVFDEKIFHIPCHQKLSKKHALHGKDIISQSKKKNIFLINHLAFFIPLGAVPKVVQSPLILDLPGIKVERKSHLGSILRQCSLT